MLCAGRADEVRQQMRLIIRKIDLELDECGRAKSPFSL
jgi:hypothetical protein